MFDLIHGNIVQMIENTEFLLENYKSQLITWQRLFKIQGKPKGFSSGSFQDCVQFSRDDTPLQKIVDNIEQLENMIFLAESELIRLNRLIALIKQEVDQLTGVKYKVAYMKLYESLTLKETMIKLEKEGLYYSENYIKQLRKKVKTLV